MKGGGGGGGPGNFLPNLPNVPLEDVGGLRSLIIDPTGIADAHTHTPKQFNSQ